MRTDNTGQLSHPVSDTRDALSLRALQHVLPRAVVGENMVACGCEQERVRLPPAHLVFYYVLTMTLFMESSCQEVSDPGMALAGCTGANVPSLARPPHGHRQDTSICR